MTMDKSLRVRRGLARSRSVLTRAERLTRLQSEDRWKDGDSPLGLPTAIAGAATALVVLALGRKMPWKTLGGISWGVLPLVAGLFVLVEALDRTGVIELVATFL